MLHITFPPTSHSAPTLLTATLMQEAVTIHERLLKSVPASCPGGVLTQPMGKADFPESEASAKQCQTDRGAARIFLRGG